MQVVCSTLTDTTSVKIAEHSLTPSHCHQKEVQVQAPHSASADTTLVEEREQRFPPSHLAITKFPIQFPLELRVGMGRFPWPLAKVGQVLSKKVFVLLGSPFPDPFLGLFSICTCWHFQDVGFSSAHSGYIEGKKKAQGTHCHVIPQVPRFPASPSHSSHLLEFSYNYFEYYIRSFQLSLAGGIKGNSLVHLVQNLKFKATF